MIKDNELRVRNWIQTETGRPVKVDSIFGDRFNIEFIDGQMFNSPLTEMEPIPLMPDILEKCGFKNYELNINRNVSIKSTVRGKYCYCDLEYDSAYYMPEPITLYTIEYLHQLQNLYFALTGSELEINL